MRAISFSVDCILDIRQKNVAVVLLPDKFLSVKKVQSVTDFPVKLPESLGRNLYHTEEIILTFRRASWNDHVDA